VATKVLHVIKQLRLGGAERAVVQIATNLPAEYESFVCAFRDGPFAAELRDADIQTLTFFPPEKRFSRRKALKMLSDVIDEVQPDIVHTHMLEANLIGGWAAVHRRIPTVCHVQGPAEWELSLLHRAACKYGYQYFASRGARFVAVSQGVAEGLRAFSGVETTVVHNAVDTEEFRPQSMGDGLRADLGLPQDALLIGDVARLEYQKNPQCMVRAARRVVGQLSGTHFLLVGVGALSHQVVGLALKYGVEGNIHLLGARHDVPGLLPQFDVFALPSRFEGLPLCFAEAMACGLPVVGTDVVGVNEIVVDGETGYLVPSDDHEALAERIVELLRDEDLRRRMGEAGRRRVEEHFSIPRMIADITRVYEDVLSRAAGNGDR